MIPLPTLDALDAATIPTPCTVSWDDMRGTDRTRFCNQCRQNVHDVSEMTRAEALGLLTAGETAPCLRLYLRPDGRVMTADCATRRERVWKWLDRRSARAAALFALVFFAGCERPVCVAGGIEVTRTSEHVVHEAAIEIACGVVAEGEQHR